MFRREAGLDSTSQAKCITFAERLQYMGGKSPASMHAYLRGFEGVLGAAIGILSASVSWLNLDVGWTGFYNGLEVEAHDD